MKLYTEEQVKHMIRRARFHNQDDSEMFTDDYLISCEASIILSSEDELYSAIENAIIKWVLDGTKTAGSLTREIMLIIKIDNNGK
jgi:hypothetical protein